MQLIRLAAILAASLASLSPLAPAQAAPPQAAARVHDQSQSQPQPRPASAVAVAVSIPTAAPGEVPAIPSQEHRVSASAEAAVLPGMPVPGSADGDLFTLLDYFDAGQQRAHRYLGRLDPTQREKFRLQDMASACVRVSCEGDGGRSLVFSTGVLVGGGRVLTVAHGIGDPGDVLSVILADGTSISAQLLSRSAQGSREQDWAVLELAAASRPAVSALPAVSVGAARPGGLTFILGYPERVGLGADGHAASSLASQPAPLDPLLFLARVPGVPEPGAPGAPGSVSKELEPLAGAVPLSGASGSPVFDENGSLVGILVAIGRLAYPEGVRHVYRVSLSGDFEAALKS